MPEPLRRNPLSVLSLAVWAFACGGDTEPAPEGSPDGTPPSSPGAVAAHEVREVPDIPYARGETYGPDRGLLDLYLPEGVDGFPVLLSLHGGGLLEGGKDEERHIGRRFAAEGIGTVVMNYRLSPTVSHPAHMEDVAQALAWIRENIGSYGGDPHTLFVMGHSAGGYLTGLLGTDPRYLEAHGMTLSDLRGIIPVSGFFYLEEVAPDRPESVWGGDPARWPEASPHSYLDRRVPPTLLLYAEGDAPWRREQHERFAVDLRGAGHTDVAVHEFPDRSHAGIWEGIGRPGDAAGDAVLRFIRERAGRP